MRNGNTTRVVDQVMAAITDWNWRSVYVMRDVTIVLNTISHPRVIEVSGFFSGV
jgi:hypothetical protein